MAQYLEQNANQKVQHFLNSIEVVTPPYATSREVLRTLIQRVKERRTEPQFKADLQTLVDSLDSINPASLERLPAPECEGRSQRELAAELSRILAEDPQDPSKPWLPGSTSTLVACLLWAALNVGCKSGEDVEACVEDVSLTNFEELVEQHSDFTECDLGELSISFDEAIQPVKEGVIEDLCTMEPAQIAIYLELRFGDTSCGDDFLDDDDAYKGVSF